METLQRTRAARLRAAPRVRFDRIPGDVTEGMHTRETVDRAGSRCRHAKHGNQNSTLHRFAHI